MRMCLSTLVGLCASLLASAACVQRPPPISSPPGATGEAPPTCPTTTGIDENGDPACAAGCSWDKATRQCAPVPGMAAPPAADPAPPADPGAAPPADPAPGEPLPQLPPPSKKSAPLSPSDSI